MGAYLDLLRNAAPEAEHEALRDKSDKSAERRVRSLLSLLSRSDDCEIHAANLTEEILAASEPMPKGHGIAVWSEDEEERAAIAEREGAIPRDWAEGFARLDPNQAPGDVPLKRWQRFIDDIGLFLDSPFCANAAALGWGPHDLFGCDRERPFARIDRAGLLWLVRRVAYYSAPNPNGIWLPAQSEVERALAPG